MILRLTAFAILSLAATLPAWSQETEQPWENEFDMPPMPGDTVSTQPILDSPRIAETMDPPWHFPLSYVPRDWARSVMLIPQSESVNVLAGVGLTTAGLLAIDHVTQPATANAWGNSPGARHAAWMIVRFGDGRYHLLLSGALVTWGLAMDDKRTLQTGGRVFEAMLASGIVVQVLKRTTGRESPAANTGRNGKARPFPSISAYNSHQTRYYSFPSGHITTAMSTVTVLAESYPEAGWIRPVGYGMVGLLGVSLVKVGYHWYSDLPLGILLGYTFGNLAAHPGWTGDGSETISHLRVGPMFTSRTKGLELGWVF